MMPKSRMEVFSDGVLAIVITIMVLELHEPTGASFAALKQVAPTFVAYLLSYAYVGIYWNNHHHLVAALKQASGEILWANLFWLFWMSLMPWATQWLGSHLFATAPTVVYGGVLLMCSLSYYLLQTAVLRQAGRDSALVALFGRYLKGKLSVATYLLATLSGFGWPAVSYLLLTIMAVVWLIPDTRIERFYQQRATQGSVK